MRAAATLALLMLAATARAETSEGELKARFRTRVSAIDALKDAGKIGETSEGAIAAVEPRYLAETVALPDGKRISASELIAAEKAGTVAETRERIRQLVAGETFGERFVTKILGLEVGL